MSLDNSQLLHPTAQKLVNTVVKMLDTVPYTEIKSEIVLQRSGISRGPLYHHFQDFSDLITAAHTQIYRQSADRFTKELSDGVILANNSDEALHTFLGSLDDLVALDSKGKRRILLGVLHDALAKAELREEISTIQESVNERWMKIYELCKERNWSVDNSDSRAVAIIMQAALLGCTLDDLSPNHIDLDIWTQTLGALFQHFFLGNDPETAV